MNRGKVLILLMVVAGLGAGALGVWYRHYQMNRVMEAMTPRAAELLAFAPVAELTRLELSEAAAEPGSSEDRRIEIQGRSYRPLDSQSLSDSPAFTKLRKALVQNAAYNWNAPQPSAAIQWPYLLTFRRDAEEVQFAFDPAECRIALPTSDQVLSISPVEPGLTKLMKEISPQEMK